MRNQPKSKSPEWTILKLLKWTTSYFKSHNIDSPRATAEILLAHALKSRRIDLYLRYDQPLCSNELSLFKDLIKRRLAREPVAYIVGVKEFWSMDFAVTKDVLIPRPETECLVEAALSLLPKDSSDDFEPKRILELGTGSGAIILALASKRKGNIFFASDRSIKAIELALLNAKYHNLDGAIDFFSGDWFTPLKDETHSFDMIISNPPYIQTRVIDKLEPEIYRYEPRIALDGGEDGLCSLRYIISKAHIYLTQNGYLLLEIGHDQKDDVQKIIDNCGNYEHIAFTKDYGGYYRVVRMRKSHFLPNEVGTIG